MNSSSSVTVLLPVYNGASLLREAIESVLSQKNVDFDILVIDDGSTDGTFDVLSTVDSKALRVYRQTNMGLTPTLNRGLELATGKYIARLDHDDLMLPGRLQKQVEFLDQHPDYAMVGTRSTIWLGNQPTDRGHIHPASHEALKLELLFDNPFVHSSVMMRADVVRSLGGYTQDKTRQRPEDYELWSRIARDYKVANIPEVLMVYREVQGSISRTGENPFLPCVVTFSSENLSEVLAPTFSIEECYSLASLYHGCLLEEKFRRLRRSRVLKMHKQAAIAVGGAMATWSDEFRASYNRQHGHLRSKFSRRYVPNVLLNQARKIKRFLKKQIKEVC